MEMLVVVLMIGILATLVIPGYMRNIEQGRAAEAIQVLSAIADAEERYRVNYGAYTDILSNLDVEPPGMMKYFKPSTLGVSLSDCTGISPGTCGNTPCFRASLERDETKSYPSSFDANDGNDPGGYILSAQADSDANGLSCGKIWLVSGPYFDFLKP